MAELHIAQHEAADRLVSQDPLALLIAMVLDQQIPLEKAFRGPLDLQARLGHLDPARIADEEPDRLASVFAMQPALHRFPASMAERVQQLCRIVRDEYGGDTARLWTEARDGAELLRRVKALPGFGEQKARIFVALLGKQLAVRPRGWREASKPFGDPRTSMSVADIDGQESLQRVRSYKKQAKAAARSATPAAAPGKAGS
ncbi:MAG TPA: HhH-GPD-type base excision DNA repair protein [Acidimicrobiales bacterium]|nr:HhH-GPD-type base excision DNA repair protein [Acidimicrobiales bacterium]